MISIKRAKLNVSLIAYLKDSPLLLILVKTKVHVDKNFRV